MSADEQFANACNELQQRRVIRVQIIIYHDLDHHSSITALTQIVGDSFDPVIQDYEMDVAGWGQFGKSIKTSTAIKHLHMQTWGPEEITPEVVRCPLAFFNEVKENTSIVALSLDIDMCAAIPVPDLRYFFHNNHNLRFVNFVTTSHRPISLAQSTHLSAALRDLTLENLQFDCSWFANNGAFQQVLFASQKINRLLLFGLKENYQLLFIADWLRDPTTILQNIYLKVYNFNLDKERVENEILTSLVQNTNLQSLRISGLFQDGVSKERIKQLLCNTSSIHSIIESNHSLLRIKVYDEDEDSDEEDETIELETPWQQYAALNKNPNKNKVIQAKIMQFYFSGDFDPSSIANMPLSVLANIMGLNVQAKQSSIFNILKSIPELCSISSRAGLQSQKNLSDSSLGVNKRQKTGI